MRILKKLSLALMLCLALLGCQAALAETVELVPASRIEMAPKIGVVMSLQKRDGYANILVDTEKSDFEKAISYGGYSDENFLGVRVTPPAGAAYAVSITGWFKTDAEVISAIDDLLKWGGDTVYSPVTAGTSIGIERGWRTYSAQEELLSFYTNEESFDLAIRWYDADKKTIIRTEVLHFNHSFTNMQNRSVKLRMIPATDIQPNVKGLTGITYDWHDGELIYYLSAAAVSNTDDFITTRISVPKGTKWVRVINYYGDEANRFDVSIDGYFTVLTPYKKDYNTLKDGCDSDYASYVFLDAEGNLLPGGGKYSISYVNQSNNHLALAYLENDNWRAVPESRLHYSVEPSNDLVKLTYSDGVIHISANPQKTNPNEQDARILPDIAKRYRVTPPQGATAYQVMGVYLGGPDAFGSSMARSWMYEVQYCFDSNGTPKPIPASGMVNPLPEDTQKLFWQASSSQHGVNLFKVSAETELGRASIIAVEWTFADGKTVVEWFGETSDVITLKPKTYAYAADDELPSSLNGPTYIWKNGQRYTLYAEFRAQTGSNAYVVDLKLLDENGNVVTDFDGPLEFYLPYPQGHGTGEGYTYNMTHYFAPNMLEHEAVLEMTCEPQGVHFKVSSLSPIELSWNSPVSPDAAAPSTPPQTGDASHTPLWLALCLLSLTLATLLVCKRKKAK